MARLHTGIIALCLFALPCTAQAQERIIGTVRLMEDHLLFASPATTTSTPNQYVKVICHPDEDPKSKRPVSTPTTDVVSPIHRATTGDTLTILEVIRCGGFNGAQVRVRTPQNITGYTLLPNYHTHIKTTDAEAAYQVLFLNVAPCTLTQQEADPECQATDYAHPFANYARLYPTSPRVPLAAEFAAIRYQYAADIFEYLATSTVSPGALEQSFL